MTTAVDKKTHAFEAARQAGREPYKVKDLALHEQGRKEIRLAEHEMPGLMSVRDKHKGDKHGHRVRLVLVTNQTRGKHGRLLAYAHLVPSGETFNELLLTKGHAYADTRFPHPLRNRYKELEAKARQAKVGLWKNVKRRQMPGWRQRRERR